MQWCSTNIITYIVGTFIEVKFRYFILITTYFILHDNDDITCNLLFNYDVHWIPTVQQNGYLFLRFLYLKLNSCMKLPVFPGWPGSPSAPGNPGNLDYDKILLQELMLRLLIFFKESL